MVRERRLDISLIESERKRGVAWKRAFVKFIENHEPDIRKLWVRKKSLSKQPFRHNLEPRRCGNLAFKPHLVADSAANRLAAFTRYVGRAVARSKPPRLEHYEFLPLEPWLVKKRGRHASSLAASWRRSKHDIPVRRKRAANVVYLLFNWEHHAFYCTRKITRTLYQILPVIERPRFYTATGIW